MGTMRKGTIDKCRYCKQRIRFLSFTKEEIAEEDYYFGYRAQMELWAHDPWVGVIVDWQGNPVDPEQTYRIKCNPEHVAEGENWEGKRRKRQTSAEPDSYCTEIQENTRETCWRRITDREFMKCGIHARPERQRQIEAEERRRQAVARAEQQAIEEYEQSLIDADVKKLPESLRAQYYGYRRMFGRKGDEPEPMYVIVDMYALMKELGIEV
jgi:hypothetical protein